MNFKFQFYYLNFFFAFFFKKERLESVVEQLKSLGNQHEEIKIQLQQANDLQNYQVINQLQSELDHISTKQMQLVNEQSEINKQLRRYEK